MWKCQTSHLWCNVVWRAAEGACGHAFIHILLTHAKVCYLDVAFRVQHHVVKLEIPAAETGCECLCRCTFLSRLFVCWSRDYWSTETPVLLWAVDLLTTHIIIWVTIFYWCQNLPSCFLLFFFLFLQFNQHFCLCSISFSQAPLVTVTVYLSQTWVRMKNTRCDMKNRYEFLAEALKKNKVTLIKDVCPFYFCFCIRMISMDLILASFLRLSRLHSLNSDRAARLNLHIHF